MYSMFGFARCGKVTREDVLHFSKSGRVSVILLIIFITLTLTNISAQVKSLDNESEDISVLFQVDNFGNFYSTALYTSDGKLFVSVEELFSNLKIPFSPLPGKPGIEGFITDEENNYSIDYSTAEITYNKNIITLNSGFIFLGDAGYIEISVLSRVFGIHLTFNFRSLSAVVRSDFELPAIKEKRLSETRMRLNRGTAVALPPDTTLTRQYHALRFGMADWYLMSAQVWGRSSDYQAGIALGAEVLGGETNLFLNYSDKYGFEKRMQNYSWRWVDNSKTLVKQVLAGKIISQSISSVYYPVVGATFSNTATTTRKASGEYIISDFTEPDWLVELYINNELADFTRSDASGMYVFKVPLVYGFTTLNLRFYGPMGEERSDTRTINIPYNFMPAGEFEYKISTGFLQDGKATPYGRAETTYGLSGNITVGAGLEYLKSIPGNPAIPFLKASFLPFPKLIITGEYDHGVRSRSTVNYYPFSSALLELDYIHYNKNQKAILYNYLEERKMSFSVPLKVRTIAGFARLGYKQNVFSNFNYNMAELLLSGYYKSFNSNISTYANWLDGNPVYVNTMAAISYRLKNNITLRSTAQFDMTRGKFLLYKGEIEKRFARTGYFSFYFEDNIAINNRSINFSLKYDLNFAQVTSSARISRKEVSTFGGLRGSLMFGKSVQADANSKVGRGGLTIIPFLDVNHNGIRDSSEKRVENLNIKINGGRIRHIKKDTSVSISGLEPFINYDVEMSDRDFDNISWRIAKNRYQVMIDPNQFKVIEVPVAPMAEVNGMIYPESESAENGLGRIVVRIYDSMDSLQAETMSEHDGYWSYLGLEPGKYYCTTNYLQMTRLNLIPSVEKQYFLVNSDENGEMISNINFILNSTENKNKGIKDDSAGNEARGFQEVKTDFEGLSGEENTGSESKNTSLRSRTGKTTGNWYYIQAGAFGEVSEGEIMVQRLKGAGRLAFAFVNEDSLNCLRIGYFRKESEAVSFSKVLLNKGIPSIIGSSLAFVKEGNLSLSAGNHFVQTGAFRNENFARAHLKMIASVTEYPTGIIIEDGYYKVRVGYFKTPAEAKAVNKRIRNAMLPSFRADEYYYNH